MTPRPTGIGALSIASPFSSRATRRGVSYSRGQRPGMGRAPGVDGEDGEAGEGRGVDGRSAEGGVGADDESADGGVGCTCCCVSSSPTCDNAMREQTFGWGASKPLWAVTSMPQDASPEETSSWGRFIAIATVGAQLTMEGVWCVWCGVGGGESSCDEDMSMLSRRDCQDDATRANGCPEHPLQAAAPPCLSPKQG
jgi:hypothetical protein